MHNTCTQSIVFELCRGYCGAIPVPYVQVAIWSYPIPLLVDGVNACPNWFETLQLEQGGGGMLWMCGSL